MSGPPRIVAPVLAAKCPAHGMTCLMIATQGGIDLQCGCTWAWIKDEWVRIAYRPAGASGAST